MRDLIRVTILGAKGVGKSAILAYYFANKETIEACFDDLGEGHSFNREIEAEAPNVDIFISITSNPICLLESLNRSEAFVLVFSITDRASFLWAKNLLENEFSKLYGNRILLLANKSDLQAERKVSLEEANRLQYLSTMFYEASATDASEGLTTAFHALLRSTRCMQLLRIEHPFRGYTFCKHCQNLPSTLELRKHQQMDIGAESTSDEPTCKCFCRFC